MATQITYGPAELMRRLRAVIWSLSGQGDQAIANGLKARLAVAFFSKVKQAFIVKARGGTDDAGITWPPLNPKTLAYSRRNTTLEVRQRLSQLGRRKYAGRRIYQRVYRQELARISLFLDRKQAMYHAHNRATAAAERAGQTGPSKISVARNMHPGADYEILRDTGILFNSLQPGIIAGGSYVPVDEQIYRVPAGMLVVGTNVYYSNTHHYGDASRGIPARPLWPAADQVPKLWQDAFNRTLARGLDEALQEVA